ncbi:hypothetical protein Aph02nite_33210 [Actinoplanes philippinensis]|uniref:Mce-associated membrane protein n=1 Tax=Actinoplanes philippinensis TaxID=35752 RepID=A0A1I2E0Z0_9ACTN|nr:hypothetical protein [Actinoplanes philippinensis]GIE77371.1 hypothetical protein Aph02nite_33210 [Actinoplanes philippinensis]SFE85910.1 hypothetical protein SAMN05421541_10482 [Actinoplanes philippinensis]
MPLAPRRTTAVLAAALALTATSACATTATTTVVPRTAPSAAPVAVLHTPTPAPPAGKPPTLANTGTAWPRVLGSLIAYGQWLTANPNPALATTITEPGCASANQLTTELRALVADGDFVKPSAPILTSIIAPSASPGTISAATIGIRATRPGQAVYHSPSTLAGNVPSLPPTAMTVSLVLGADSHWRICTVVDHDDPDGEAFTTLL